MTSWLILKGTSSEEATPLHYTAPHHTTTTIYQFHYPLSSKPPFHTTHIPHSCTLPSPELRTTPPKPSEPHMPAHRIPSHQSCTEPPLCTPAPSGPPYHPAPPRTAPHRPAHTAHMYTAPVTFRSHAVPRASPGASCCGLRLPGSPRRHTTRAAASGHDGRLWAAPDVSHNLRPERKAPGGTRHVPQPQAATGSFGTCRVLPGASCHGLRLRHASRAARSLPVWPEAVARIECHPEPPHASRAARSLPVWPKAMGRVACHPEPPGTA